MPQTLIRRWSSSDDEFDDSNSDKKVDSSDDEFDEADATSLTQGNMDTMLTENVSLMTNKQYVFAPGEGKMPVFHEPKAEYLCFPTIYCGQERPTNEMRHRKVFNSEILKHELKHCDP